MLLGHKVTTNTPDYIRYSDTSRTLKSRFHLSVLVCNLNANDKCEWQMQLGDQCSFFLCAACAILPLPSVWRDFLSDKTFTIGRITSCSDSFCRHRSSHSHSQEWKHSYTNSMWLIFLSHSHSSFPFALRTSDQCPILLIPSIIQDGDKFLIWRWNEPTTCRMRGKHCETSFIQSAKVGLNSYHYQG